MTARTSTALLIAGLAAVLLAGCGSGDDGRAASGTTPPSSAGPSSSGSSASGSSSVAASDAPATGNAIAGPTTPAAQTSTPTSAPPSGATPSTVPSGPSASFSGFVGTWDGHSRRLVVSAAGHVTITFRTYVDCTATVTTGCDRITGNAIIDGGTVGGHVGRAYNATTVQVVVDSTTDPRDFPARPFTLGHDLGHHAIAARVGGFTDAPFCGSGAPNGYCGA